MTISLCLCRDCEALQGTTESPVCRVNLVSRDLQDTQRTQEWVFRKRSHMLPTNPTVRGSSSWTELSLKVSASPAGPGIPDRWCWWKNRTTSHGDWPKGERTALPKPSSTYTRYISSLIIRFGWATFYWLLITLTDFHLISWELWLSEGFMFQVSQG